MRLVFTGAPVEIDITNMFDVDGDETDDPEMATRIVGQLPDGRWLASTCLAGDIVRRDLQ